MIEEEMTASPAAPADAPAAAEAPKPRRRRTVRAAADEASAPAVGEAAGTDGARRRRSRKADDEAASASAAETEAEAPKRRTRARKDADAAPEAAAETAPRRRGRPRKAAPASDAAEPAPAEAPSAPEAASGQTGQASQVEARPGRRSSAVRAAKVTVRKNGARQAGQSSQQQGRHDNQKQNRGHNGRNDNQNAHHRQRQRRNAAPREVAPSVSVEELAKLKVAELRAKAADLGVEAAGLKKAELVEAVYDASVRAEGFIEVTGVLDILADGYGFLRTQGYLPSEQDCYVGLSTIRRNGLRKGDMVRGQTRPARENEKYAAIQKIISVNGLPAEELGNRVKFSELTPIFPDERLAMEHGKNTLTARVIDLVAPIGKGQRGLIVSPPKAGKTTVLKNIAAAITANNPEVHLMYLGIDERPEEATDMERSIRGEVVSSTFDMPCENHIAVAELVIERAKRLVEMGKDVVILLDSITRLARAYNLAQPASGRILSGGVDSTALYPPKRFLGAARNIENGGSLTILASALIDTGSKMDEVIFEEFKGTGNMELKLDRNLADRRVFPAIDPITSGTRKEELLLDPQQAPLIWAVRRILANMNNTERAMDMLIKSLKQTDTNAEFLLRTAKKAQHAKVDSVVEL
ncbi:MAG TPA: transcription termination factor Rho [Candidatus Aphodovivens avistercoris]|nr:transcription termination factor Rho [Candidatus Aphodovivens avistercoris]